MIIVLSWNAYWEPISAFYPKQKIYVKGDKTMPSLLYETMLHENITIGDTRVENGILTSPQLTYTKTVIAHHSNQVNNLNISSEGQTETGNIARKTSVERACANYPELYHSNGSPTKKFYNHLYVDEKHKMIYCAIPKVGSTNWIRTMVRMRGTVSEEKAATKNVWTYLIRYVRRLGQYSVARQQQMLEDYYKVVFVREPIDRLLSAYKDKLANHFKHNKIWFKRFGRPIIRSFRPNATREEIQRGNDTTFKEFVQYVIQNKPNNRHWSEYNKLCRPCQLKYDFIGKYETMDRDAEFILRKVGVKEGITFPKMYKARLGGKDHFFQTLSQEEYKSLWEVYYADYLMFNYSYPDYLHVMAQS